MWIAWERAEVIRRRALGNQGEDNETGGEEEAECKVGTLTSGMFHNRILFVWDFRLNDVRVDPEHSFGCFYSVLI